VLQADAREPAAAWDDIPSSLPLLRMTLASNDTGGVIACFKAGGEEKNGWPRLCRPTPPAVPAQDDRAKELLPCFMANSAPYFMVNGVPSLMAGYMVGMGTSLLR